MSYTTPKPKDNFQFVELKMMTKQAFSAGDANSVCVKDGEAGSAGEVGDGGDLAFEMLAWCGFG